MAHTGPRTNANVLNYHIGRFNVLFTFDGSKWVYHSELVDDKMAADLGDMLGGLNYSYGLQYPGVPFPTDPDTGGTTPPPSDPKEAFKARQKVSQNCAWVLITPQENGALIAAGINVAPYNNFYTVGGSGGLGLNERVDASSPSGYVYTDHGDVQLPDVDQAADKRVKVLADEQERTVPAPVNVP